jgi:lambda family phage tail tape measure protein
MDRGRDTVPEGLRGREHDAATATERAFANAFGGAEDSLVGLISTGKLEFRSLADSIIADITRMAVRQTITAPIAGLLQGAVASGGFPAGLHFVLAHFARHRECSRSCRR